MAAAREPIALHWIIDNLHWFVSSIEETRPPSCVRALGCESKGRWRERFGREDRGVKSTKWGVMHARISLRRDWRSVLELGGRGGPSRNLCLLHIPALLPERKQASSFPSRQAPESRAASSNLPGRATLSHSLLQALRAPDLPKASRGRGPARRGAATRPPAPGASRICVSAPASPSP